MYLQQYEGLGIRSAGEFVELESPRSVGSLVEPGAELEPALDSEPRVVFAPEVVNESGAGLEFEVEVEVQGPAAAGFDLQAPVHKEVAHTRHSDPIRQRGRE